MPMYQLGSRQWPKHELDVTELLPRWWLTVTARLIDVSDTLCQQMILTITIISVTWWLAAETRLVNRRRILLEMPTIISHWWWIQRQHEFPSLNRITSLSTSFITHLMHAVATSIVRCNTCLQLLLAEMTPDRISLIRLDKMDRSCSELALE